MNAKAKTIHKAKKRIPVAIKSAQYVIPLGNGWVVKNSLAAKFTFISDTKREAVKIARDLAKRQRTELIVHAKDGSIQRRVSFAAL